MTNLLGSESPERHTSGLDDQSDSYDYSVRLQRDERGMYGLAYRATTYDGLVITGILQNSAADTWNCSSDICSLICVGDSIMQVNCKSDAREMVQELRSERQVELALMKTGPRWHLLGKDTGEYNRVSSLIGLQVEEEASAPMTARDNPITAMQCALVFVAASLPTIFLVILVSDIGFGIKFYGCFWDDGSKIMSNRNYMGSGMVSLAASAMICLYVLDWTKWENKGVKIGTLGVALYLFCIGWIFKAKYYPQVPHVLILFHVPVFLGILKGKVMKHTMRKHFYLATFVSNGSVAVVMLVIWLLWMTVASWDGVNVYGDATKANLIEESKSLYTNTLISVDGEKRGLVYEWDCDEKGVENTEYARKLFDETGELVSSGYRFTSEEKNARAKACAQVKTTWFLVWLTPFIATVCNLIIAIFCLINAIWLNTEDTSKFEKILKNFILMMCFILMMMWVSSSIAGASMRLTGTLMAFCGSGMVALCIWLYMEVGTKALTVAARNSKVMQSLIAILSNDWVRALLVIMLNGMIPFCFFVNMLNQKVRRIRGLTDSNSWFTSGASRILMSVLAWRWSSILTKTNLLVMLYWTMSIGVAKLTYVFLSWLNQQLLQMDLVLVLVIFFMTGLTMFLLPPVPGIPVYILSGILIAARTRSMTEIGGFWGGVIIATFESFILKLMAVVGQYMIGLYLGKSVKVQQLIAVDKVITRAIEKILQTRGLNLPKVSVLVGGPDWPTSVLCGILKLNLLQCIIGTTPVIFVSTPCVLAGAFLAGVEEKVSTDTSKSTSSIWDTMANTMLAVSALCQLACAGIAMYYIQEFVHKYGDDLSKPRAEHEPIAKLTQQEAEYNQAYETCTDIRSLSTLHRILLLSSTGLFLITFFIFMMLDSVCFRNFQINSRICDDYADDGLNCNWMNIVKGPGWAAMGLFSLACVLHIIFVRLSTTATRNYLKEQNASGDSPAGEFSPMAHEVLRISGATFDNPVMRTSAQMRGIDMSMGQGRVSFVSGGGQS